MTPTPLPETLRAPDHLNRKKTVTTEPEVRELLDRLHHLAEMMDQALHDSALPAASYSGNEGAAPKGGKSKLPCSTDLLEQQSDITDRLTPICANLATDLTIGGRPFGETAPAPWVKWLRRHRVDLIARTWWPVAEEELRQIHRELSDQFAPPTTGRPNLPDFATAEELATVVGKSVAAVHRWCGRHRVEAFTIGGVKHYRTTQVID